MVEYVSVEEARQRSGLRIVMVGSMVPSPWGEAAKGILHVENVAYVATRMGPEAPAVLEWTGHTSAPIAVYEDETPRTGWAEILLLAERLAARPSLIPARPDARAEVFGLAHEICGEDGLGWARRLALVHSGLNGGGGFAKPVAQYLAGKYGYRADNGDAAGGRVVDLLAMFAARLQRQKQAGSDYLVGDGLTAADIYLATFIALFQPLPPPHCDMPQALRDSLSVLDDRTRAALTPNLVEHRDRIYERHLELPLTL